jgi:hypothetical protein
MTKNFSVANKNTQTLTYLPVASQKLQQKIQPLYMDIFFEINKKRIDTVDHQIRYTDKNVRFHLWLFKCVF